MSRRPSWAWAAGLATLAAALVALFVWQMVAAERAWDDCERRGGRMVRVVGGQGAVCQDAEVSP